MRGRSGGHARFEVRGGRSDGRRLGLDGAGALRRGVSGERRAPRSWRVYGRRLWWWVGREGGRRVVSRWWRSATPRRRNAKFVAVGDGRLVEVGVIIGGRV
jgi:hypothetical protein